MPLDLDQISQAELIAMRLLARREYSAYEVTNKLKQKKIPQDIIQQVLTKLQDKNWQSDLRYATMLLRHGVNSCWGPNKIKYNLLNKGISSNIIDTIFIDIDNILEINTDILSFWTELARNIVSKKFPELSDLFNLSKTDYKTKSKIQRFLYNRGFDGEHINFVLKNDLE